MIHYALLSENRNNPTFAAWNKLIETLNFYESLYKVLTLGESTSRYFYSDQTFWTQFADSTGTITQSDIYQLKQKNSMTTPMLVDNIFEMIYKGERYPDIARSIGLGLLKEYINVENSDLTIIDFFVSMVVHYDTEKKMFYKNVDFQVLDDVTGEVKLDNKGSPVWDTKEVYLTAQDFSMTIDQHTTPLGQYKYATKKADIETGSRFTSVPIIDNGDGTYTLYLTALHKQETYDSETKKKTDTKEVDVHHLANLNDKEIKAILSDLGVDEQILNNIDIFHLPKESLILGKKLFNKAKESIEDTPINQADKKSWLRKSSEELSAFTVKDLLISILKRILIPSEINNLVGRLFAFGRNFNLYSGQKVVDKSRYENKDGVLDKETFYSAIRDLQDTHLARICKEYNSQVRSSTINLARAINHGEKRLLDLKLSDADKLPINSLWEWIANVDEISTVEYNGVQYDFLNNGNRGAYTKDKRLADKNLNNYDGKSHRIIGNHDIGLSAHNGFSGITDNFFQQWMLYHIIGCVTAIAINELLFTNLFSMRDLNGDGKLTLFGERGSVFESYATDSDDPEINNKNNLTSYKHGLKYAAISWVTDYIEVGGDIWEAINGYTVGYQIALIQCGMVECYGEDMESIANTVRGLRQIKGKSVPSDPKEWIRSPAFQRHWKRITMVAGAFISGISESISRGIAGFAKGGVSGAIIGTGFGWINGVIGVLQSHGAGILADHTWQSTESTYTSRMWKDYLFSDWTIAMKGDCDGLIFAYNTLSKIHEFGSFFRWEGCEWMYLNTYFDLGIWSGPFDSWLAPLALVSWILTWGFMISSVVPTWVAKLMGALLTLYIAGITLALYTLMFRILKWIYNNRRDWLPEINIPDPQRGDLTE